jgi:hypothetical protein
MANLEIANEVRRRRSRLKAELAAGEATLAKPLLLEQDWTRTMKVADLLKAVPGLGRVKVKRAPTANRIGHGATLGGLTATRRGDLLEWLVVNHPSIEVGVGH